MRDTLQLSELLIAAPCSLTLAAGVEVPPIKWIHVASAGEYLGHHQGQFKLTREVFESFQRNLRRDPRYMVGPVEVDGETIQAGSKPTIAFDFEHASEQPATSGSIPLLGNPAPAWVLDVEIRTAADGIAQLWTLAKLGDLIRGYIANDQYRQTSIAFAMEGKDFRTNEDLGPILTSVAFTTAPYLRQIESMAASRRRADAGQGDCRGVERTSSVAPLESLNGDPTMSAPAETNLFERFRLAVCAKLNIRTLASDDEILEAVGDAADGAAVADDAASAAGTNREGVKAALAELMAEREEHVKALAEIDAILQGGAAADAQVAVEDVASVMSANGWDGQETLKLALTARRTAMVSEHMAKVPLSAGWKQHTPSQVLVGTRESRQAFLSAHGIKPAGEAAPVNHAVLTSSLVAAAGGAQLTPPASINLSTAPRAAASRVLPPEAPAAGETVIDLRSLSGRNPTEKIISHLKATDASFAALGWSEQCKAAGTFRSNHQFQA